MFFTQWRSGFVKDPTVKQVTWISGPEYVFVEDVVESIKSVLNVQPQNLIPLLGGEDSERHIWQEIEQEPVDGQTRLVLVRNAEKLKRLDRLTEFVTHRAQNPATFLVFVSRDENLPRLPPEDKYGKGELMPYLTALSGRGHIIECKPITTGTAAKAVQWVMDKSGVKRPLATYLLERANGDLRLVRDLCAKLHFFQGEVSITTINAMLSEQPRDDLADALLALDKKTALLALAKLSPSEYSAMLGLLDSRLDFAGMLHDMQVEQRSPAEIARAAGNKNFLVKDVLPLAKHYNAKRRLQIRNILAMADEALRSGIRVGPMEAIIAFW